MHAKLRESEYELAALMRAAAEYGSQLIRHMNNSLYKAIPCQSQRKTGGRRSDLLSTKGNSAFSEMRPSRPRQLILEGADSGILPACHRP